MNVFGDRPIGTVVDTKLYRLSLLKRPASRVDRALMHLQAYSLVANDCSDPAVLIEASQCSSHERYAFPKFEKELELAGTVCSSASQVMGWSGS